MASCTDEAERRKRLLDRDPDPTRLKSRRQRGRRRSAGGHRLASRPMPARRPRWRRRRGVGGRGLALVGLAAAVPARGRASARRRPAARSPSRPRAATSTSWWSRSTRRARTASAATASRRRRRRTSTRWRREGVALRARDGHRAPHLPVARVDLHRPLPPRHGVRDNGGFFLDDDEVDAGRAAQAAPATRPAPSSAAWVLESRWGLAQGFDALLRPLRAQQVQGRLAGHRAEAGRRGRWTTPWRWLEHASRVAKFFAWVHLYDPHAPYEPPEPFASRYPGQPYLGEIAYTDAVVGRLLAWLREQRPAGAHVWWSPPTTARAWATTARPPTPTSSTARPRTCRSSCARPGACAGRSARAGRRGVDLMPTVLDLVGLPPAAGRSTAARWPARSSIPQARAGPRRLLGDVLPALPLRLAAPAQPARRALHVRRRARAGALRPRADPGETKNVFKAYSAARRGAAPAPGAAGRRRAGGRPPSARASTPRRCSGWPPSATWAT